MYALMAQRELFESNKTVEDFSLSMSTIAAAHRQMKERLETVVKLNPRKKGEQWLPLACLWLPLSLNHGCAWLMVGPENDLYQESGVYVRGWSQEFSHRVFLL